MANENPKGKEALYLCSFGDSRYARSRKRLKRQADRFNLFKSIYLYDEHDLSESFVANFEDRLKAGVRGFGYWVWKPWIILETLKRLESGDVLLYVDMGCHLKVGGKEKLLMYVDEVASNESGFLVSQLDEDKREKYWTKGDLIDHFKVGDSPEITETPQYQANIIFIRKTPQTVALIESWLEVFYNNFQLVDDTPSVSPNATDFQENRHDQSVLSLLLKKGGSSLIPFNEVYSFKWDKSMHRYPIHLRRDLSFGFWQTLFKKLRRLPGKPKRMLERRRAHRSQKLLNIV